QVLHRLIGERFDLVPNVVVDTLELAVDKNDALIGEVNGGVAAVRGQIRYFGRLILDDVDIFFDLGELRRRTRRAGTRAVAALLGVRRSHASGCKGWCNQSCPNHLVHSSRPRSAICPIGNCMASDSTWRHPAPS